VLIVVRTLTPKKGSLYQGKPEKAAKAAKIEAKKSTHKPSPPATAGDAIDLRMKTNPGSVQQHLPREAVLNSMRRSYSVVGKKCFDWYKWSPHINWAIAQVKLEQRIEEDEF
jgi:hypothetical protein